MANNNNNTVDYSSESPHSRDEYSSAQSIHSPVVEESPRSLQEKFPYLTDGPNNYSNFPAKQM